MRRSITSNFTDTGGMMTFKDAAAAVGKAWRKRHGNQSSHPALSHALSILDGNAWTMLDCELGEPVAIVRDGVAVLTEEEEEADNVHT